MHPRFILYHNLEWSNLEPWKPVTNSVGTCNKQCQTLQYRVIPSHQTPSHVHCLFPKALQQTRGLLHKWVRVYVTYSRSECMDTRLSPLLPMCALINDTFELPFNLSFWSGCSVFFTHFCRWPFSLELELWVSMFSKMSPFLTSFVLLAMLCKFLIMDFLLVFQHS